MQNQQNHEQTSDFFSFRFARNYEGCIWPTSNISFKCYKRKLGTSPEDIIYVT